MDVFDLVAKIKLDISEYEKGLGDASKETSSFSSSLKTGLEKAAKVATAAITAASTAVVGFGKSAVDAGIAFDKSMAQVAATMGVTVDDIEELRDFAQEMGRTTAFSATEAAEALNYMALAGYDAQTSMKMLPNVLNLAAAGGIELGRASDMITDAQTALGLTLEDTNVLVDQMAKTASKSNTSVAQLGDAILTIGGTAQYMKGGINELNTVLGLLADNGIKGSEAGTHLRNMLLKLSSPTDDAAGLLNKYAKILGHDLVFDEVTGEMIAFEDIFQDLNKVLGESTDEEKMQAFSTLFNARDIAAANALLNTTTERWEELSGAIGDAKGASEAMAETQLDNLAGDITLFQSALEGAKIAVSDKLTPTLRKFVEFGTSSISTLTGAFKEGGLAGVMGALGDILSQAMEMFVKELPNIVKAGGKLISALANGIVDNMDVIFEAAGEIFEYLVSSLTNAFPRIIRTGADIIIRLANGIAQALPELIPTVVQVVLDIVKTLTDPTTISNLVDAAIAIVTGLLNGIINAIPILLEAAPVIIENLVTAIVDNLPKIIEAAVEIIATIIGYLNDPETILMLIECGIKIVIAVLKGMYQLVGKIPELVMTIVKKIVEQFGRFNDKMKNSGKEIVEKFGKGVSDAVKDAVNWGKDLMNNFLSGIKEKWNALKDSVSNVAKSIKEFLGFSEPEKGPLSNFHTYAPDMMKLFAEGIRKNEYLVTDQIAKSFDFDDISIGGNASYGNLSARGGTRNVTVVLELDKQQFARTVFKLNREEQQRMGVKLVNV